ncbi:hypothetical protein SAMN05421797_11145 [Maribacter ulvicola]|uniref:Uncharacterized protein n=1 Tax=Maribacter ulvicola TaxID=228959 RepID=A0A1N7AB63_9FLAO|nr:hypothetical protein SAMN05421797_11145 [Maribacter ulvicola]
MTTSLGYNINTKNQFLFTSCKCLVIHTVSLTAGFVIENFHEYKTY